MSCQCEVSLGQTGEFVKVTGNTYPKREMLKMNHYRWNPVFKYWYSSEMLGSEAEEEKKRILDVLNDNEVSSDEADQLYMFMLDSIIDEPDVLHSIEKETVENKILTHGQKDAILKKCCRTWSVYRKNEREAMKLINESPGRGDNNE